jgi:diguanylate cyclase (GGDEF)-like protein
VFANGRKTIGVFVSQVNEEFQETLSKGISTRAKELNYNVAFFTNFGGYGQQAYDIGELKIADLPNYEDLDGIILAPDTMVLHDLEARVREHIKDRCHCPIVSVRRKIDEYYNVMIDDSIVINEIITHFIKEHKFTRINFLAGPKEHPDSVNRLESYKRILRENNIPIEKERIYHGDFWKFEGYNAVDYWLKLPIERPQAIVCANDNMAITVCNALAERGISVPGEIAVTGCDDAEDAAEYSPSITTARMPIFEMGMEAVEKINKHNLGIEQPKVSYLNTNTIYRSSCGCKRHWYHESNERRRNHILERDALKRAIANNAYMSTDLTGITKLEEVNQKIWGYIYENSNFTHFCLCLNKDWDTYNEEETICDDEMIMDVGFKDRIGYSNIRMMKKDVVPNEFAEDRPMIYFIALLHHQEHYFGHVAISFDKIQTYMLTFQAWLINVSNALENVRIHGELNRLVYRLEDMYIRDDLTGLFNRRVLETLGQKYLQQCVREHVKMMVFTADMDKLKYINDNYGHMKGDIALKVVADSLMQAADENEICIRLGGDEFMVLGKEYNEKKIAKFINRFVEGLDNFNRNEEYPFDVFVSYGWNLFLPDENTTLEGSLIAADSKMYQQKYEKETNRIKTNLVY